MFSMRRRLKMALNLEVSRWDKPSGLLLLLLLCLCDGALGSVSGLGHLDNAHDRSMTMNSTTPQILLGFLWVYRIVTMISL